MIVFHGGYRLSSAFISNLLLLAVLRWGNEEVSTTVILLRNYFTPPLASVMLKTVKYNAAWTFLGLCLLGHNGALLLPHSGGMDTCFGSFSQPLESSTHTSLHQRKFSKNDRTCCNIEFLDRRNDCIYTQLNSSLPIMNASCQ